MKIVRPFRVVALALSSVIRACLQAIMVTLVFCSLTVAEDILVIVAIGAIGTITVAIPKGPERTEWTNRSHNHNATLCLDCLITGE